MIVTCPQCKSKYSVQPDAIGSGKLVRCAMCFATWQQTPVASPAKQERSIFRLISWIVFFFFLILSVSSLFFAKDKVLNFWPASICFYESLGLAKTKIPFEIRNVSNFFVTKNSKLYMGLRGELINSSKNVLTMPSITISLRDEDAVGETLKKSKRTPYKKSWTHDLQCKKMLPQEKIVFETELQSVPSNNLICDIKLNTL